MKTIGSFTGLIISFLFLFLNAPPGLALAIPKAPAGKARIVENYGKLPLSFEKNQGQADEKVKFLSRGSGYNLFLTATEAVLSLRKPQPKDKAAQGPALHKADKPEPATVVSMKLVGANADARITGANQLPGKVNYFLGKDPKKWRTNIPTYARVRYTNVYPGIDLVFYGQGQKLEYDFIVAPGADPGAIALCFGQTRLKIEQNGDLALDAKGGELRLQKPLIYQDIDGIRKPVPGGYVLHPMKNEKQTHRVGFKVAAYDRTRPLVIDPVLVYSTYLGGSSDDYGRGIAVDATGSCYVTGYTESTDFPTQDPLYPNNAGDRDAFVSKISMDSMAEWTFFVYLGADNSLSFFADADLEEMQRVGSDSNVNVVTLVDQTGDHDTHFYKVEHGSLTETALSEIDPTWIDEVDMSDPNTLITSANYVINQYPAKRYCIVLWNHGDGWRKEPKKLVYRGIIEDKGNMMRMDDVGHALRDIKAHLGSEIDFLGFDACLMEMIEVAYEIRDHAKVMVGSEDLIGAEGWPYDTILEDLVNDPAMDSETFARNTVDRYAELCDGTPYWTLSALRLNMAYDLAMLIDDFADSLTSNWDEIRLARSNSQEFAFWYLPYFHEHVDLYDFCSELNTAEAQAVMRKVDDMVINERHDSGLPDSHGLAIYFPANGEDYDSEYHASPDHQIMFPVDTSWDEFLSRYYGEPIPDIKANGSDDPLFVTPSESVDISISLDPGDMAGEWADWWGILLSSYGTFPLFGFQCPLFELPETSLFSRSWPVGWYIFLFGLDDVPDGAFELDWYDYVVVVSQPAGAQLENIPNFDDIVKEKMGDLIGE